MSATTVGLKAGEQPVHDHRSIYYPPGGILMWIIVLLEVSTFTLGLIGLVYYGLQQPELFHESRQTLNVTFGAVNTVVLLTSGFFMAGAVQFFKKRDVQKTKLFLYLTTGGGLLFVVLKVVEYIDKLETGLTVGENMFFTFYWVLTLFHLLHVLAGIAILIGMYIGVAKNGANASKDDFESGAAFWHMCDLIWLLLFPSLYLLF